MATIMASCRPIRDRVERSNEPNCRISPIPLVPADQSVREQARDQYMVPPKGACRDRRENSNAAIVRALDGSGFLALTSSAAVEIFSAKGVPRAYPGANPNVRSKRLA
jgi:hypothetical protein